MKKILSLLVSAMLAMPVLAGGDVNATENDNKTEDALDEFVSDERLDEGFLTHYLNEAIANGMAKADEKQGVEYGRKVTDYVSTPKFGGYFIGKYAYSSQDGKNSGDGFTQRLIRLYVDGKILNDFAYRIQVQTNNSSFHMKDFFLEWQKYKELRVKIGQYKRAFGFENPLNPWDVGTGEYSLVSKKMAGFDDNNGIEQASNGGRDQGIQVQGDLFPVGKDGHSLIHYQLMVANGQGINAKDADTRKDVIGTIQIQPIKGLVFGFFGWTGSCCGTDPDTKKAVKLARNRYMFAVKYDANDWTVRGEYAHSQGHSIGKREDGSRIETYDADTQTWSGTGKSDAWYATVGVPCTKWLKTYVRYEGYRDQATWESLKSIYSIAPNIQLHKNLMFQVQYNYVHDKTLADKRNYSELWVQTYVRF